MTEKRASAQVVWELSETGEVIVDVSTKPRSSSGAPASASDAPAPSAPTTASATDTQPDLNLKELGELEKTIADAAAAPTSEDESL